MRFILNLAGYHIRDKKLALNEFEFDSPDIQHKVKYI